VKYLFLGLLFTVRLEHLQEKTLKEHNSLGRCDQFLVSSRFPNFLFNYFYYKKSCSLAVWQKKKKSSTVSPVVHSCWYPWFMWPQQNASRGHCCCERLAAGSSLCSQLCLLHPQLQDFEGFYTYISLYMEFKKTPVCNRR